jgi:hypothetical protein
MTRSKTILLIMLSLTLGGCASSVTQRGMTANAEGEKIFASCEQDAESRDIEVLAKRTNFFNSDAMPLSMLVHTEFATEEEKVAIVKLADAWKLCGEKLVAWAKTHYNAQHASLYQMDINRALIQLANLYNGDVKWSIFNIDLQISDNKFAQLIQSSSDSFWAKEYADAEQTRRAFGAALQAYGNALKDYGNVYAAGVRDQQTTSHSPIYDPKTTECRSFGNQTTCTQYSALMSAPKIVTCTTYGNRMTCQ